MCNGIRAVWPKGEEKEYMGDGEKLQVIYTCMQEWWEGI
jgi:hypothetical protein